MKLTASVTISPKLAEKFQKLTDAVKATRLADGAMAGGQVIEAQIKVNIYETFSSASTGGLAGSVRTDLVESSEARAVVETGPRKVYGAIHEFGGLIVPVTAPYLEFKTEDGKWVRTKQVHMPARPYVRPAFETAKEKAINVIAEQIRGEAGL